MKQFFINKWNTFKSKLDVKSIIIIGLALVILIGLSIWYFSPSKSDNKILKTQISNIQKERDSLAKSTVLLENKNKISEENRKKAEYVNSILTKRVKEAEIKTEQSIKELATNKAEYDKAKKEYDRTTKNPIVRSGDDLIQSLTKKLNN